MAENKKLKSRSFVSSLFNKNSENHEIKLKKVAQFKEELFSQKSFQDLDSLHPHLVSCLQDRLGISKMTKVQQLSIPFILNGRDCLVKSATGSGKTLSYLVPILQMLQLIEPKINRCDGIYSLIIVPTRELVVQCFQSLTLLCNAFARIVPGCLMGGEKKKSEKNRIRKGINILISTPARLIDHMEHTVNLKLDKVKYFVIDEADRLYEHGFEEIISQVVLHLQNCCSVKPQTILLSATLTKGVEKLAGMSLNNPHFIDIASNEPDNVCFALPSQLVLHYMIVPAKLRLMALCAFIVKTCSLNSFKLLVFMSNQDSVDFHEAIFSSILNPLLTESGLKKVSFFRLHGSMNQPERMAVFNEFQETRAGVLLCTDVASRGLDIPKVDWIIQYCCPPSIRDFLHRAGRTARIGSRGDSLSFILSSEVEFLKQVQNCLNVNIEDMNVEEKIQVLLSIKLKGNVSRTRNYREYVSHIQILFENTINEDSHLLELAKKAYISYIRSYASYPRETRNLLPFKQLHIGHVAKSFCLRESPSTLGAAAFVLNQTKTKKFKQSREMVKNKTNKRKRCNLPIEMRFNEYSSGLSSSSSSLVFKKNLIKFN